MSTMVFYGYDIIKKLPKNVQFFVVLFLCNETKYFLCTKYYFREIFKFHDNSKKSNVTYSCFSNTMSYFFQTLKNKNNSQPSFVEECSNERETPRILI